MPLAPVPCAQYATEKVAKGITAPIYVTQPSGPPLAEFIPYLEKQRGQVQEQFKTTGMPAALHYLIPLNNLHAVVNDAVQMPVGDAIAQKVFGLTVSTGLDLALQKSVFIALSRAILELRQ